MYTRVTLIYILKFITFFSFVLFLSLSLSLPFFIFLSISIFPFLFFRNHLEQFKSTFIYSINQIFILIHKDLLLCIHFKVEFYSRISGYSYYIIIQMRMINDYDVKLACIKLEIKHFIFKRYIYIY